MRKSLQVIVAVTLFTALSIPVFALGAAETGMPTLVLDSRLWSPPEEQEFVINEVLKPFGEENGVKVALSIFQDEDLLARQKVQSATGNQTTDIVIAYASRFTDWVNAGYVEDLTSVVAGWTDRTFSPGINSMAVINGKQYFVPIASDVYLLCANQKAMKYLPSGADVQDLTWNEFADWANAIARGENEGKVAVTGVPQKALIYQVGGMGLSFGAGFPDVSSAGAIEAWKIMIKMRGAFTPTVATYDNPKDPMKRGEAWLTWAHVADVGDIYKSNPSQYVIAPVPKGPEGKGSIAGTQGFAIPVNSPNRDVAIKLIEYMTRPDIMLKLARGAGGWIPPVSEAVDQLGSAAQDEVIKMAIDVMDNGNLSFLPPAYLAAGNWGQIKQVYDDIARRFLNTGRVDTGYLRDMQAKIEGYK
jgi:multiple sugar transport system substrate-binding protein